MPIIVAIAGNSGDQTITIIIRALDSGDISKKYCDEVTKKRVNRFSCEWINMG